MVEKKLRIVLKPGDPNEERAALEYISDGEKVELECTAEKINSEKLIFLKDQKEIKSATKIKNKKRIVAKIDSFNAAEHAGNYLCALPTSSGVIERTVVLKKRHRIGSTSYVKECDENICRNGGKCFVPLNGDKAPFCSCPTEYAGQYCESHAISSYAVQSTKAGILMVSLGASVLLLVILIGMLIYLGHRYRLERVKRKKYQSRYGKISVSKSTINNDNTTYENEVDQEMQPLSSNHSYQSNDLKAKYLTTIESLEDFNNIDESSIRKQSIQQPSNNAAPETHRKHRDRLDATSTPISF